MGGYEWAFSLEKAGGGFFAIGLLTSVECNAGLNPLAEFGLLRSVGYERKGLLRRLAGGIKIAAVGLRRGQGVEHDRVRGRRQGVGAFGDCEDFLW